MVGAVSLLPRCGGLSSWRGAAVVLVAATLATAETQLSRREASVQLAFVVDNENVDPDFAATAAVVEYCEDCNLDWEPDDEEYVHLERPDDVWAHVSIGYELLVRRRVRGDGAIHVQLGCGCTWDPEHGLQLVFREGRSICTVGPNNGHLTHADAYGDARLEGVLFRGRA